MTKKDDAEVLAKRLELATRAARIAVWEVDLATLSLYWSPVFMDILGIPPEALRGHVSDFWDRLVPEDHERVRRAFDAHVYDGVPYDIEYEMFHESGRRVTIAAQAQASLADDGTPLRIVGTVRDVTDRSSLEARLLEAESVAHIGHWIVDIREGTLTWSPETFRIHGLEPGALVPNIDIALGFYHPEDRPIAEQAVKRIVEDGLPWQFDARLKLCNGDVRHVHVHGAASLAADGTPERVFGVMQDRTEFVRKERELERARRLETLGQLAGGVAHDFNNLMTVIVGNLELLQAVAGERLVDGDKTLLEEAVAAIMRGRDLTQGLLSFAQSAALRPEWIAPLELMSGLQNVLRRTLPASIDLVVAHRGPPVAVRADRGNLEACLINLAINARDAIDGSGEIVLATECLELEPADIDDEERLEPGRYVCFSVSDNGCGMPVDVRQRIFEPFFTTKPVGEGSGLGLPRVLGFARQSRGAVRIHSEVGAGTRVEILLPVTGDPAGLH